MSDPFGGNAVHVVPGASTPPKGFPASTGLPAPSADPFGGNAVHVLPSGAAPEEGNSVSEQGLDLTLGDTGSAPPSPPESTSGPFLKTDERYAPETGILGHTLGALDYAGNVSRSFLTGAGRAEQAGQGYGGQLRLGLGYAKQALDKKRESDPAELKKILLQNVGLSGKSVGVDNGRFDAGDIVDKAGDLGLAVVTDPLTYLSAGTSAVAKGVPVLAEGARAVQAGEAAAPAAKSFLRYGLGVRAGTGALLGYGAADQNASPLEKVGDAALGATLGAASGPLINASSKVARSGANALTDWYATTTRGSKFSNISNAFNVAHEAFEKTKNWADMIRQGRLQNLESLAPEDQLGVSEIMKDLKTQTIKERAAAEAADPTLKEGTPEWNDMARGVNDKIQNEYLPTLLKDKAEAIGHAVNGWAEHNERVIGEFNKTLGRDVVGMRFHIPDVYKKEDFDLAEGALKESQLQRAKALERSGEVEQSLREQAQASGKPIDDVAIKNAANEASYGVYSHDMANKFLNQSEKEAIGLMHEYKMTPAQQPFARGLEKTLGGFDKLTNMIKAKQLYFSMTWVKNNLFDNLTKAYAQNGLMGLADTATMGARHGIMSDMNALLKGETSVAWKSSHVGDAIRLGVWDGPMFKTFENEGARDFLFSPAKIEALSKDPSLLAKMATTAHSPIQFFMNGMTRIGSFMEGTARMSTYINTLDALKADARYAKLPLEHLKEIAADTTRKAFFDYGDVTMLEKAVMKRLIPFYSFYSKNLPYWAKATFDPERLARIANVEKVRRLAGREPNADEKMGMTPYLAGAAPRMVGTDKHGNKEYLVLPSSSQYEAIKYLNPSDLPNQFVEKSNPIPKTIYELWSGKDLFAGGPLYPSDSNQGKKYLYSRGFKYYAAQQALVKMGIPVDSAIQRAIGTSGVKVDSRGNPYTTKDWTIVLDKVASTVLPHGLIDQVAGSLGKVEFGKEAVDEAITNRLAPYQVVKVSPDYARLVRARNMRQDMKETLINRRHQ